MQNFFQKIQEIKLENALYIVATPIGNLTDISLRALKILQDVDFIICEDTRVSMKLLKSYEIEEKKLLTYNDHSDEKIRGKILGLLQEKKSLALISDAGTPLISDPGYKLISFLRQMGQKIIPIPGSSSLTSAICASGIACDNFLFLGFLPSSKTQKIKLLKSLPKNFTFIAFEAPTRIVETLSIINEDLNNRRCSIAREISKIYEEIVSDDAKNLLSFFSDNPDKLRGEFVLIVEKADKNEKSLDEDSLKKEILKAISCGLSIKDLSQSLADIYGLNKKEVYKLAIDLNKNDTR